MRKYRTKVITDESQVPAGFKRISSLADSITDQKKLSDAHTDGLIEAVKLMRSTDDRTGPVWVDASAAERVLHGEEKQARRTKVAGTHGIDTRHAESVCESLASMNTTMDEIYRVLERLTAAVENIAKHPLARLDDCGIVEQSSNGFHN